MHLETDDPHGRNIKWKLYSVSFQSPDGTFAFHIYAISDDHAQMQVDSIKENAKLDGLVVHQERSGGIP